jgi:hypothetical protein
MTDFSTLLQQGVANAWLFIPALFCSVRFTDWSQGIPKR